MGKRGNGEGTISRRKNGGWMAQYYVHTAEGRKRKTIYGRTRAEVAKKLAEKNKRDTVFKPFPKLIRVRDDLLLGK